MSFEGLRIGLVGPLAPPAGGMALQTEQLARLLRQAGASVEIVQTNAPYKPAFAGRIPALRALFRLLPYLARLWGLAGRSDVIHLMANSGWSWHLFAAPAVWIAHARGTPVVVNYRGGGAADFLAGSPPLLRQTLARTAALIVPSGFLQKVFGDHGLPAAIVPNVIDLGRYSPGAGGRDPAAPHLIVTRNLEPIYDNASAIRALALLRADWPGARLTVAGSGPELAMLQALAAELGVAGAVHFAGRLDRAAMAALYRSADLMFNPSVTDNMPNSVLEALAAGVPVVSTNVGGVPYLLEDGRTGLLVEPRQAEALAAAARRVLGEPELRRQLIANGLREVQRYTWDQVAPLLRQTYRAALGSAKD